MNEPNMLKNPQGDNFTQQTETIQAMIQSLAFVIAVFVCVVLCSYFGAGNSSGCTLPPAVPFDSRINPNEAPLGSLVRLPGVGISRAEAIVAYRQNFRKRQKRSRAFQTRDDLQKIKGIGPKTVQNITDSLKFN